MSDLKGNTQLSLTSKPSGNEREAVAAARRIAAVFGEGHRAACARLAGVLRASPNAATLRAIANALESEGRKAP